MKETINNKGMTLIELMIVCTVIGILVTALFFDFEGWASGYKIESQIKELYMDLINTKARAMQRNRMHFIDLTVDQYNIYEDNDPMPNGNGIANIASDTQISQRFLEARYPIIWSVPADTSIEFDTRGLSSDDKLICSDATDDDLERADYNCIIISATRINMGKLNDSGGACAAANCITR